MMRLSAIAMWTRGQLLGNDTEVAGVALDSRAVQAGNLFVAIAGERVDGHDFLADVAAHDAGGALVSRRVDSPLPQVLVNDTTLALGDLASAVRAQRDVRVVGITGSNGKSTTKTLVAAILGRHGRTHVSAGNHNNELGLPLSVLAMPADTQYAVFEMGAGKPGDIAYLAGIARPEVALVTLVAPAHLERMGSVEGVASTKGALYEALPRDGVAVINADDRFAPFFTTLAAGRQVLRFGLEQAAEIGARDIRSSLEGSRFVLRTPHGEAELGLSLPGRHNVMNALAAAAVATALQVPLPTIVAGLESVRGVPGRLQRQPAAGGWSLIDDSYNANPGSMAAAIDTLLLAPGEHWLVLGDMAELGAEAVALHAALGRRARERGIERLFATGPLGLETVRAFGAGGEHYADQQSLLAALRPQLHEGVTCLVKGSRSAGMERVVQALRDGAGTAAGGDTHAA
jgi:UDP-N-acetylmuramoyl-tripeptide--D-alanyl-D-alanine ligase